MSGEHFFGVLFGGLDFSLYICSIACWPNLWAAGDLIYEEDGFKRQRNSTSRLFHVYVNHKQINNLADSGGVYRRKNMNLTTMRKQFLSFLLALLPLMASADPVLIDGIYYNLNTSTHEAEVVNPSTDFDNPSTGYVSGSITIPATVTYENVPYNVTSIGYAAFYLCTSMTSISIPSSVTTIGLQAFLACRGLESLELNNVTSIGEQAFAGCSGLTTLGINSVTSIGKQAFAYCTGLGTLAIPNNVKSIGEKAFEECNLTSLEIGSGVESIGYLAFSGNPNLTTITVSDDNNNYDSRGDCNALIETEPNKLLLGCKNTVIPDGVTTIGDWAFYECSGLTSVTIPQSVTYIDNYAFAKCTSLTTVTIPSSVTYLGYWVFAWCSGLTTVTIKVETPLEYVGIFLDCNTPTLYVPAGCLTAYQNASGWSGSDFSSIVELNNVDITIGAAGMGTYYSNVPLGFTGTDDIKAYIVSAFRPSTGAVTLTRITDVPANTGIVVKGAADTYNVPVGQGETVVANMLTGVTTSTVLNKVSGDYTNFILAKKNGVLGFYVVADGTTLGAHKAYLPLPTAKLPTATSRIALSFDDNGTDGIEQIVCGENDGTFYDLQGRRVATPTHGLYILNGKKVFIK